ncbi:MAG: hypothetical protein PHP45_08065 [Elusimicrobiales bacterium]|nr:hypothetical protein [Elusimicrobiales bacterium]
MRKLFAIGAALALCGCQSAGTSVAFKSMKSSLSEDSAIGMSRSMKGYELYSWKAGEEWKFALLEGTNRLKTYGEITASPNAAIGADGATVQLSALASGEQIFWNLRRIEGFSLPTDEIIAKITAYCQKRGLLLEIINW